ncbi:hypothetical protein BX661DRAFT_195467 [Kickxella alabastrina]|uniref:uncharacterized protein n=1 Tax=Kickxella alabastrina TaxID=61397 RepID=UPI00221F1EB1|nr:uncharacterized protein BX661DRAFT_195467 [Kickxella alabastrina]KAI7834900.1 hypothetical protein BX661DRAFT_195467 [Kickxella alabastrina]
MAIAAETMLAATKDAVALLRVNPVHNNRSARYQEALVINLEHKQNPKGRRRCCRVAEVQARFIKVQARVDTRAHAIAILEAALQLSTLPGNASATIAIIAVGHFNLRVILLEAALSTRYQTASELPMRQQNAQTLHSSAAAAALSSKRHNLTALWKSVNKAF